jgi:hypothetical protein
MEITHCWSPYQQWAIYAIEKISVKFDFERKFEKITKHFVPLYIKNAFKCIRFFHKIRQLILFNLREQINFLTRGNWIFGGIRLCRKKYSLVKFRTAIKFILFITLARVERAQMLCWINSSRSKWRIMLIPKWNVWPFLPV